MENWLLLGMGLFWCGWSATYIYGTAQRHRRRRQIEQAWLMWSRGQGDEARAIFEEMAHSRDGYTADSGRHGIAWFKLEAGDYAAALEGFGQLRETGHFEKKWRQSFYSEAMAICAALSGDTTAAEARLNEATHSTDQLGRKAAALVACKQGDFEAALAIDPDDTGDHHDSRAFRLLIAFALDARGDEGVEEVLRGATLDFPGEFDYITRDWPELREFVERNPLPTPPADLPRARVVASRRVPPSR